MIKSEHYTKAGVNIDAADELIERIKPLAASTRVPGVTGGLGGFGGVFDLAAAGFGESAPRLVSGTDGVGTKLKLAFATGVHNTIGVDCVAMCVNDIITIGAKPLFFLDYFATGRLEPAVGAAVVEGIAAGCRQASCALLGGETAEMPGMYPDGEYDLAGFVVGAIPAGAERPPENAQEKDVLIGVRASGLHSNGFSLARRVLLDDAELSLDAPLPGDALTLGARLLTPTRIYVRALDALATASVRVTSCSHITGGGLWENPQRAFGTNLAARFDLDALRMLRHDVFGHISRIGGVPEREMYRVFNMGIGLVLSVSPSDVDAALEALRTEGEEAAVIGELVPRDGAAVLIEGVSDTAIA